MKKYFFIFIFFLLISNLNAETPHFVDFKYILNESTAGKKAQNALKSKLNNGLKNLEEKEKKIQDEERKIIQQKKLISPDEYKKKVSDLRKKVSSLQSERNKLLENISKERSKARKELLKNLNPILSDYMKENNVRMIIDRKSILLADENLDITDKKILRLIKSSLR